VEEEGKELKNVITDIFKSSNRLSNGFNQYSIEQIWRELFGTAISSYTTRVNFYKGTLTVYINSSPLKNEIMLNKENVIARLNKVLKYNKVTKLQVQ